LEREPSFGEGNKGLHSFVRELAASGAPRLHAKLGLAPGSAAARIRRVAYERIGLAIARGHAQQLLARLGCVDVCRAVRNAAHVGEAVLACEAPTLLIASNRGISDDGRRRAPCSIAPLNQRVSWEREPHTIDTRQLISAAYSVGAKQPAREFQFFQQPTGALSRNKRNKMN
jgi:hypothetical protein